MTTNEQTDNARPLAMVNEGIVGMRQASNTAADATALLLRKLDGLTDAEVLAVTSADYAGGPVPSNAALLCVELRRLHALAAELADRLAMRRTTIVAGTN